MLERRFVWWLKAIFPGATAALLLFGCAGPPPAERGVPEEAIRANVLGTAYLGQMDWPAAEAAFREGLAQRPDDPVLRNNLAIALMQQTRTDAAAEELRAALAVDPDFPWARYNLGLVEKNDGDFEAAAEHFAAVAAVDPDDLMTQYNLGVVLSRLDRPEEARQAFRNALAQDPTHVSSLYGLGRFLLQLGEREEGTALIARSQEIRARSGLDEAVGLQYGEQGPYAMGADYPADALGAPEPIAVRFEVAQRIALDADTTAVARVWLGAEPGATMLVGSAGEVLAVGSGGIAVRRSIPGARRVHALAAGDLDREDPLEIVALVGDGTSVRLVVGAATGTDAWREVSLAEAGPAFATVPGAAALVLVDRDHDGDLDLFACARAAGAAGCLIGTNDGSGSLDARDAAAHGFDAAPLLGEGPLAVAFTDHDNDRDVDLIACGAAGPRLLSNRRDGGFDDVTAAIGLDAGTAGSSRALAVADANKDGWMDLVLAGASGVELRHNRKGRFDPPLRIATGDATGVVVLDHDNDGFLDLLAGVDGRLRLWRSLGGERYEEAPAPFEGVTLPDARPLAALDANGDGDLDVVAAAATDLVLLDNAGGNANRAITIASRGAGDNRYGIGAKVEVFAGALRQKFEVRDTLPLHAGLGRRERAESLRYLWPQGVLQDEVNREAGATVVEQLDRKGTSCPLLYAWRDGRWHFVTDFLGGAAVGYRQAPGRFGVPDPDEYVRIDPPPAAGDGTLRVRLNNQLEEVIWFDAVELVVVDHPRGTEVWPNERLMPGPPWPEFRLFASPDVRPVRSATSVEDGTDRTAELAHLDRRTAGGFAPLAFKGYAEPHSLELDLGPFDERRRVVLLLDGWIDYADSSSNLAASQAGVALVPPRLLVANGRGGWIETHGRMGFPAGLPKAMAVELDSVFPSADHRVRIETNMRIHWDRARVLLGGEETPLAVRRLRAESAELRFGGFPARESPDGRAPFGYDPQRVQPDGGFKAHAGRYTAFGDVKALLDRRDDRFVTTRNGDEIELRFAALPPPAEDLDRTVLVYAVGFGKDMDVNSLASDEVAPFPFHGMPSYPYPEDVVRPVVPFEGEPAPRVVPPSPLGLPGAVPPALPAREEGGAR